MGREREKLFFKIMLGEVIFRYLQSISRLKDTP